MVETKGTVEFEADNATKVFIFISMCWNDVLVKIPMGYFNDKEVEGNNKLEMRVLAEYVNQTGVKKVNYPKYYQMYTNGKSNNS